MSMPVPTMQQPLRDTQILECFDRPEYAQLAYGSRESYQNADPFPHIHFDNFLPDGIADALAAEYPAVDTLNKGWKYHDNQNVRRYFLEDTRKFSTAMRLFASAIQSRSFILFLETLTGIPALLGDPYFMGGGAMVTGNGGFLSVHVDFNWHQKLQAWRRVNALFYLTPGWQPEWGGDLEIWATDGARKVKSIAPLFNRLVVFSTTSESYHGQPVPIAAPDGKYRNVFSAFFYASTKSDKIDEQPHYTRYNQSTRDDRARRDTSPYAEGISADYLKGVKT